MKQCLVTTEQPKVFVTPDYTLTLGGLRTSRDYITETLETLFINARSQTNRFVSRVPDLDPTDSIIRAVDGKLSNLLATYRFAAEYFAAGTSRKAADAKVNTLNYPHGRSPVINTSAFTITAPYKCPRILAGQTNFVPPLIPALSSMSSVAPPQRPPSRDAALHLIPELNLNGKRQLRFPTPPTSHELVEMCPTLASQIPHIPGSSFFHSQERAFFSRDNSKVQIDIDLPQTNQSPGGPYWQEKGNAQADSPPSHVSSRNNNHHNHLAFLFLLESFSSIPTPITERASEGTTSTPADEATLFTDDSDQPSSCCRQSTERSIHGQHQIEGFCAGLPTTEKAAEIIEGLAPRPVSSTFPSNLV